MRLRRGDKVRVKGENGGEGEGRIIGIDRTTGNYRVHFDQVETKRQDGSKACFDGLQGYATPEGISRR